VKNMARLNLSNINNALVSRLKQESKRENLTFNEIVSIAISFYFSQLDSERIKEEPIPEIEIDLDSKENKEFLKQLREQKEELEKQVEISEIVSVNLKMHILQRFESTDLSS